MEQGNGTKKRVSRREVAKAAGVSLTTVTHALNPPPGARVNRDTVERVKRIATELEYRPNFIGRALRTGKNYTVGLLQPGFSYLRYLYYQDITSGLSEAMDPENYKMLLLFRKDDFKYMEVIDQGRVDGFIIIQSDLDNSHIDKVALSGIPTVVINKFVDTSKYLNLACVCPDCGKFVKDVLDDFQSAGCKSILEIHDYLTCDTNSNIHKAFSEEAEIRSASGISMASLVPSKIDLRQQFMNLFRSGQRWDGIFIDDSSLARTFTDAALECGLEAAKDYVLITTDTNKYVKKGLEYSFYFQQGQQMGHEAWKLLSSMLENKGVAGDKTIFVPYEKRLVNNKFRDVNGNR